MGPINVYGLIVVLGLGHGLPVRAQQAAPKLPRIGVLVLSPIFSTRFKSFQEAFQNLDYVEGKNFLYEYRNAEGKLDRLPELAAELARAKVDVIYTATIEPNLLARADRVIR